MDAAANPSARRRRHGGPRPPARRSRLRRVWRRPMRLAAGRS